MTLSFNSVKSEAAEILSEIQARSFDQNSGQPWSAAAIADLLHSPGTAAVVVLDDSDPAGFLLSRRAGPEAEILSVCVLPAYRKKAIGHQVIRHFQAEAKRTGIREIFLEVAEYNNAALALYGKNNFEIVGRRRHYYGNRGERKQDALIMKYRVK